MNDSKDKISFKKKDVTYKKKAINKIFFVGKFKYIANILLLILIIFLFVNIIIFLIIYNHQRKKVEEKKQNNQINCNLGFYLPRDDLFNCKKCSVKNCKKCYGTINFDICISCDYSFLPIYENENIKECIYLNENEEEESIIINEEENSTTNEEENSFIYEEENASNIFGEEKNDINISYIFNEDKEEENKINNKEIIDEESAYINIENKCKFNYSFKAEYFTNYNHQTITLINNNYKDFIIEMIIDDEKIESPICEYNFPFPGKHIIYFLFDIKNITNLSYLFYLVQYMTLIYFTCLFDTKNIENMAYMFYYCINLESIDLSNFNTQNVKYMGGMFSCCFNLLSIDLSNFDTRNLEEAYYMFSNCYELESINISHFNTFL